MYTDHYGEMQYKNWKSGQSAQITFQARGWNDKNAFKVSGFIKDEYGNNKLQVEGFWNQYCKIIDCETKKENIIWEYAPITSEQRATYGFQPYAQNINHLNLEILRDCCYTDTRLRPDQRAFEEGLDEIAATEKLRLEQAQRERRKQQEQLGMKHDIRWFKETLNQFTQERVFEYKGGYWESRDKKDFKDILEIY